jgi:dimethylsulfone monooxygenase
VDEDIADGSKEAARSPILGGRNEFKLAVFGPNLSGGNSITRAPGTIRVTWPESKRIAIAAERAGFEAVIPVARWKGFGGETNFNIRSFETFTWAAALAAVTESIQIFATFHVPTAHPVRAAKEVSTVDHIANGRFGLNLVAGWNASEIGMFGTAQLPHDERYEYAEEWINLVKRLWTESEEFDFDGKYFQVPATISEPKPVQAPYPPIMSAGTSTAGRAFAARHADISFINLPTFDATAVEKVAAIKDEARSKHGRSIKVMSSAHIVCADTEDEARKYFDYYVKEVGDLVAARNYVSRVIGNVQGFDDLATPAFLESLIAGAAATLLIGTPEQVVEGLAEMAAVGLDGVTLSWVDYEQGIAQYDELIRPLLISAGVRVT